MSEIERRPLMPALRDAKDIVVTYVQEPGGPDGAPDDNAPVLHITYDVNFHRKMMLVDIVRLEERGLPTDYDSLVAAFPDLRWSAR